VWLYAAYPVADPTSRRGARAVWNEGARVRI
jgi:hypothetical protein